MKIRIEIFFIGKTGVFDHPSPIFVDHSIFLTINKVRWSDCSDEDWSKRVFFPADKDIQL